MHIKRVNILCKETLSKLTDDAEQNEYLLLALMQKINDPTVPTLGELYAELCLKIDNILCEAYDDKSYLTPARVEYIETFEALLEQLELSDLIDDDVYIIDTA